MSVWWAQQWALQNSWSNQDAVWGAVPCAPRNQMEIHIGATGRIRLNNSCAAAMRRYLKLLWPFVLRRTIAIGHFRHFFLCGCHNIRHRACREWPQAGWLRHILTRWQAINFTLVTPLNAAYRCVNERHRSRSNWYCIDDDWITACTCSDADENKDPLTSLNRTDRNCAVQLTTGHPRRYKWVLILKLCYSDLLWICRTTNRSNRVSA